MKKVILALLILGCIGAGGLYYWMGTQEDRTAPAISFSDELILYREGEDQELLLKGVTAQDDMDGDVSDTLMVQSVLPMKNQTSATVIYCAKDRSNNIGTASRQIEYRAADGADWLDYELETEAETAVDTETESETEVEIAGLSPESPRIYLTTDQYTVKPGEDYSLLSFVKDITDDQDGPDWLYYQIHIAGMHDINGPGTYELYYSVVDRDNNMSNRAKLTLTIE